MNESRNNWWLGLVVIALGVLILLGNLGIAEISVRGLIRNYWPLVLVILGLRFLQQKNGSGYLSGGIIILLGLLLQGKKLGLLDFDVSLLWKAFWPAILILLGISILTGPKWQEKSNWAIMGGIDRTRHPWKLENGNYLAFMGGITLDLRQAEIERKEYFLNCTALMGGIDIIVPEDLTVVCRGTAILGGIDFLGKSNGGIFATDEGRQGGHDSGRVVNISALAVLGGVDVKVKG